MHLIRNSLEYASSKDRKVLAQALRPIYTATNAETAMEALEEFDRGSWGERYPTRAALWRRAWDRVIPFFAIPPAVRRVIYTTNAIESVNARLHKIIMTRGQFPSDEAATKLIWMVLKNITADWSRSAREWTDAMNQFAVAYGDLAAVSLHGSVSAYGESLVSKWVRLCDESGTTVGRIWVAIRCDGIFRGMG